jgi:Ferritin-like domain
MSDLTLTTLDRDGALLEQLADLQGSTRAEFLSKAALGGATLLAAFVAPPDAEAQSAKRDIAILNFALALEYLQDSFYSEVERLGGFSGQLGRQARIVGAHERAHVEALRKVLGSRAISRARYDFRGATEKPEAFRRTAVAFEDLAVAAYKGQAPYISDRGLLVAALGIHTVEARHAAWIRRLAGTSPAPTAFDEPRTAKSVLTLVERTNFTMKTGSRRSPRFTG